MSELKQTVHTLHEELARAQQLGPEDRALLESALADLSDGPPARALEQLAALAAALPAAAWHHAEALFFAGRADSALPRYQAIAADPRGPFGGAALERVYLIEDAGPHPALATFGRIAYERWRGADGAALALTDSLARALPRGPLWARAALLLAGAPSACRGEMDAGTALIFLT